MLSFAKICQLQRRQLLDARRPRVLTADLDVVQKLRRHQEGRDHGAHAGFAIRLRARVVEDLLQPLPLVRRHRAAEGAPAKALNEVAHAARSRNVTANQVFDVRPFGKLGRGVEITLGKQRGYGL